MQSSQKTICLEIRRPKESLEITKRLDISDCPAHCELKIHGKSYQSDVFLLGSEDERTILRVVIGEVSLPLPENLTMNLKLYLHLPHEVCLFGLQDVALGNQKFPLEQQIPLLNKCNNLRIYNVIIGLFEKKENTDPIFKNVCGYGEREEKQTPFLPEYLKKKASELAQSAGEGPKSPAHLLLGIALALLKKVSSEFVFYSAYNQLISDEFSTSLLSKDHCYLHSPHIQPQKPLDKTVYLDLKNKRYLAFRASGAFNLPKMHNSGIALLPNGNYLMTGGMTKDNAIIHRGLFYLNPRHHYYRKITEMPFNLHKQSMHYHKGYLLITGGVDHKDDKPASAASETGHHSTNLNRFCLRTRQWANNTAHHSFKSNDKVCSILDKNRLIVFKGTENIEIYNLGEDQNVGKPGTWTTYKVRQAPDETSDKYTAITVAMPAKFFKISGQIYIFCKKTQDTANKFIACKVLFNPNIKGVNYAVFIPVVDLIMTTVSSVNVFSETDNGVLCETVYIRDTTQMKRFVFKNGVFDEKSSVEKVSKFDLCLSSECPEAELGDFNEISQGLPVTTYQFEPRKILLKLETDIQSLHGADPKLLKIHQGTGHCFVPTNTKKLFLFGYFEKVGDNSFTLNTDPKLIREFNSTKPESVLPIPGSINTSIKSGTFFSPIGVFFFGGLSPVNPSRTYTMEETQNLASDKESWRASNKIIYYRPEFHYWKIVDYLPVGLYGSQVFQRENKLYIVGGFTGDNKRNTHVYTFDLETFTLIESHIELKSHVPLSKTLNAFMIENYVYIGAQGEETIEVIDTKEKRSFTELNKLFEVVAVHFVDRVSQNGKLMYRVLFRQLESANVFNLEIDFEGFKAIVSKDKAEMLAALTEKAVVSAPLKDADSQSALFAVVEQDDDLFGLDQLTYTMNYTDHLLTNPFSMILEGRNNQTEEATYLYSENRVVFKPKNDAPAISENESESKNSSSEPVSSIKFPKNAASEAMPNGRVLLTGGEARQNGTLVATNKTWIYDPTLNKYSRGHRMHSCRVHHCLIRVNNFIYCFGGKLSTSGPAISEVERFYCKTGQWEKISKMPYPLCKTAASMMFNRIYLFGGELESGLPTQNILIFNLETLTFESAPNPAALCLERPLKNHLAIGLNFNSVLIIGGESSTGPNMNTFKLEFSEGYYSTKPAATKGRNVSLYPHIGATAGYVDGKAIIVGGNDLNGVEVYDLRSGQLLDSLSLRSALPRSHQELHLTLSRSTFNVSGNFLHTNPAFDKLYIFGLDTSKEIWRYSVL